MGRQKTSHGTNSEASEQSALRNLLGREVQGQRGFSNNLALLM